MPEDIDEVEFTIFDTETTGLDPCAGDRIVELAALRIKGKQRLAVFDVLVNPGRLISPEAFAVNKISPEMLKDAPAIEKVMPKFLDFIAGSCLCSYNAGFDLGFLNNELKLIGSPPIDNIAVFDLLTMAKRLIPHLPRYALWFVAKELGIESKQEHRALSDVEITWEVFTRLNIMCREKGITGFTNFSNLFAFNPALLESSNEQKAGLILRCINLKATLKLRYISSHNAEVTVREVLPKEIKQDKRHKYLIGYCCLKKEERTFRLDNILSIEIV